MQKHKYQKKFDLHCANTNESGLIENNFMTLIHHLALLPASLALDHSCDDGLFYGTVWEHDNDRGIHRLHLHLNSHRKVFAFQKYNNIWTFSYSNVRCPLYPR